MPKIEIEVNDEMLAMLQRRAETEGKTVEATAAHELKVALDRKLKLILGHISYLIYSQKTLSNLIAMYITASHKTRRGEADHSDVLDIWEGDGSVKDALNSLLNNNHTIYTLTEILLDVHKLSLEQVEVRSLILDDVVPFLAKETEIVIEVPEGVRLSADTDKMRRVFAELIALFRYSDNSLSTKKLLLKVFNHEAHILIRLIFLGDSFTNIEGRVKYINESVEFIFAGFHLGLAPCPASHHFHKQCGFSPLNFDNL